MKTAHAPSMIRLTIALLAVLLTASCAEKVIKVDLNDAAPRIVIEGKVVEGPGPQTVRISMTTDFYQPSEYPPVTGAAVTIADDAGGEYTLAETEPGLYVTTDLEGVVGRTYFLTIESGGERYVSFSTMHRPTPVDSLTFEVYDREMEIYTVHCFFTDTPDYDEFYRIKLFLDGEQYNEFYTYQDVLSDGKHIEYELVVDDEELRTGSMIVVEMQAIDAGAYEFFNTLRESMLSSSGSIGGAPPANPLSNITNDALGYFSAYSTRSDTLFVP